MSFNVSALSDFTQKATQMLQETVLFSEDYGKYDKEVNIPYKRSVKYMTTAAPLQAYDCNLTISGSTIISQKELSTTWMKYEDKFCTSDYEYKGLEEIDVISELITGINNGIASQIDELFWTGDVTGSNDLMDGLATKIEADANVINAGFAGGALTNTNIDDAIAEMYEVYPVAAQKNGPIVYHMNFKSFRLYKEWLVSNSNPAIVAIGNDMVNKASFNEISVYGQPGNIIRAEEYLADDEIYATWDKNIIAVYDEVDVKSSVEIVLDPIKKENFYVLTNFKFGVDYKFGNEIVKLN